MEISVGSHEDKAAKTTVPGYSVSRLGLLLIAAIFVVEFTVMLIVHYVLRLPSPLVESLIDSLLLVGLLIPLLHLLIFRPMQLQEKRRSWAEEALRRSHGELEERVAQRTTELAMANEELKAGLAGQGRAETESERNFRVQAALGAMLRVSLLDIPLREQLELILDQITSIPWLTLESKGCVFLVEDDPQALVMRASRGASQSLLDNCARVPFGWCLCGRAASAGEVVFADRVDDRHDNQYEDMTPHGHYCVPIISSNRVLGVINLYLREGYRRDKRDEEFLCAVADVMAGIVERKRADEALRQSRDKLEVQVEERTAELVHTNEALHGKIAERKRAEEALRDSEARYRNLVDISPDGIAMVNLDAEILMCNPRMAEMLGYESAQEILGRSALELIAPEERERATTNLGLAREAGILRDLEHTLLKKDGARTVVEISASLLADDDGNPSGILVLNRDITERRRTAEALRESEERFRGAFESAAIGMGLVALDGRWLRVNHSLCELVGYTEQELLARDFQSITHSDDLEADLHFVNQMLTGEIGTYQMEKRYIHKLGHAVWILLTVSLVYDAQGKPLYFVSQIEDISVRRGAEARLRRSFEDLQKALAGTVQAMAMTVEMRDLYTAGHQRRVAQLAAAIGKEMGLPEEQVEGIRMAAIIHDVGKIKIPAEILSKPSRLTDIEFRLIMTHSEVGYEVLKTIEFPWPIAEIVLQHHERIDGSGYPAGLSGEDILLEARILAVADVVEAMASHRPYRPALGMDRALDEISQNRGTLYDPRTVDACLSLFARKEFEFEQA